MKYRELGEYFLKRLIQYEVTEDWSHELAEFGAMSDSVKYLDIEGKDRKKATDIVWDLCHNRLNEMLKNRNKQPNEKIFMENQ